MSIPEGEELTLTRAVADAISLHPCQCDGHNADTCPSAIAALAAVRKWDAEHAPQPLGHGLDAAITDLLAAQFRMLDNWAEAPPGSADRQHMWSDLHHAAERLRDALEDIDSVAASAPQPIGYQVPDGGDGD